MLLALATVLSTTPYEGDVPVAGGDYADVAFAGAGCRVPRERWPRI